MARSQRVGDDDHDLVHLYLSDVGRRALLTKDDDTAGHDVTTAASFGERCVALTGAGADR